MKRIFAFFLLFFSLHGLTQTQPDRFEALESKLNALVEQQPDYLLPIATQADLTQLSIADFLQSVAVLNELNITVDSSLKTRFIVAQFNEVSAKDVLLYLCKQHDLDLSFSGNIVHVSPYTEPPKEPQPPHIFYDIAAETISLELSEHLLGEVLEQITRQSPFTLLYSPALAQLPLQFLVEALPFKTALTQLAKLHDLELEEVEEGVFILSALEEQSTHRRKRNRFSSNFPFTVLPGDKQLRFHTKEYPINQLVEALVDSLKVNWYQTEPLGEMGNISLELDAISFDAVLPLLFANQQPAAATDNNASTAVKFSYRKHGNRYFFGRSESLSARSAIKLCSNTARSNYSMILTVRIRR